MCLFKFVFLFSFRYVPKNGITGSFIALITLTLLLCKENYTYGRIHSFSDCLLSTFSVLGRKSKLKNTVDLVPDLKNL